MKTDTNASGFQIRRARYCDEAQQLKNGKPMYTTPSVPFDWGEVDPEHSPEHSPDRSPMRMAEEFRIFLKWIDLLMREKSNGDDLRRSIKILRHVCFPNGATHAELGMSLGIKRSAATRAVTRFKRKLAEIGQLSENVVTTDC